MDAASRCDQLQRMLAEVSTERAGVRRRRCHFCASLGTWARGKPTSRARICSCVTALCSLNFSTLFRFCIRWPLNLFFAFFSKRAGDARRGSLLHRTANSQRRVSVESQDQNPTEKAFLAAHGFVRQKTATTELRVTKAKGLHTPSTPSPFSITSLTLIPPSQSTPTTRSHILSISIHSPHQANLCSTPVVDPICVLHRKSPPPPPTIGHVLCASSDHVCSCLLMPIVLYDLRPAAFAWVNCFSSWTPPTVLLNPRISLQHTILNARSHRTTHTTSLASPANRLL